MSRIEGDWEEFSGRLRVGERCRSVELRTAFTAGWFAALAALHEAKVCSGRSMIREWQVAYAEANAAMEDEIRRLEACASRGGG